VCAHIVTAPQPTATNVNNWHWYEKDLAPWAKERLEALLVGIEASGVPNKGWVRVTKLESCEGDASVSNRKGKRIVAYELNVKCKWEGQVDYDDVSGELLLPYISEDVSDSDYEIKLTAKDSKDNRCTPLWSPNVFGRGIAPYVCVLLPQPQGGAQVPAEAAPGDQGAVDNVYQRDLFGMSHWPWTLGWLAAHPQLRKEFAANM
jgi:hypothetical protein